MNDEYIKKFIKLCAKLCKKKEDYNKTNIFKHNKSMKKLTELYKELSTDKYNAEIIYNILMTNDDENIRSIAASHSLSLNINIDKSQEVLRNIIESTNNPIEKFNAEMTLKAWKEGNLTIY
ncbi:MAG: hypothetical protein HFJ41_02125 [Clostridia bacterium]|nr:hypothetical protein [Clostridia bacterium]